MSSDSTSPPAGDNSESACSAKGVDTPNSLEDAWSTQTHDLLRRMVYSDAWYTQTRETNRRVGVAIHVRVVWHAFIGGASPLNPRATLS
eukprot:7713835-Pyramimonas_sp.AAC.1